MEDRQKDKKELVDKIDDAKRSLLELKKRSQINTI
jgi:ribosomal protein L29